MKFAQRTLLETKPARGPISLLTLIDFSRYTRLVLAGMLLIGCGMQNPPEAATTKQTPAEEEKAAFVPADFEPPVLVEPDGFILKPLGPGVMNVDYEAYMSSIEHLQKTFTRSTNWPREGLTLEEAAEDMANEKRRFDTRESFAYAVLTPDGARERGCVYVRPSSKAGYEAAVRLWVTKAEFDAGFDAILYAWTTDWIDSEWPFEKVAYPGREIPWEEWEALPEQTH